MLLIKVVIGDCVVIFVKFTIQVSSQLIISNIKLISILFCDWKDIQTMWFKAWITQSLELKIRRHSINKTLPLEDRLDPDEVELFFSLSKLVFKGLDSSNDFEPLFSPLKMKKWINPRN